MSVPVHREGFAGDLAPLNDESGELSVNRADLLRGLVSVGTTDSAILLSNPAQRASEVRGLAGLLDAYISFSEDGPTASPLFDHLDRGEKGAFSHRLGTGMALLLAQSDLAIPWLVPLGALQESGAARIEPEHADRSDLVGLSPEGRWYLVVAKGRSGEISETVADKGRKQARGIALVNGEEPTGRAACITAIGPSPFQVLFTGPNPPEGDEDEARSSQENEEEDAQAVEVTVDAPKYIAEHYARLHFLTQAGARRQRLPAGSGCGNLPPAVVAPIEGTGYEIGLLEPLYEPLDPQASRNNDPKPTGELVPPDGGWVPEDPKAAYEAGLSVGRDGILVKGPAPGHLA